MARTFGRLLGIAAAFAASPLLAAPARLPPSAVWLETRVTPPLADPALLPGVARCTSDGACTVTDASGTRPGTPLRLP